MNFKSLGATLDFILRFSLSAFFALGILKIFLIVGHQSDLSNYPWLQNLFFIPMGISLILLWFLAVPLFSKKRKTLDIKIEKRIPVFSIKVFNCEIKIERIFFKYREIYSKSLNGSCYEIARGRVDVKRKIYYWDFVTRQYKIFDWMKLTLLFGIFLLVELVTIIFSNLAIYIDS